MHSSNEGNMPLAKQKAYLARFTEPRDDYERSYFKYKCFFEYCYYKKKWLLPLYDLGAMILYPFVFAMLKKRGQGKEKTDFMCDAVIQNGLRVPNVDVLPDEIKQTYKNAVEIREITYSSVYLTEPAIKICRELRKRYFASFYFRLIVTIKLAQFCKYLEDYHPKAIVYYSCEREFSGPLQTLLCESVGAKYISFMHGDYLYTLSFAFQRYSHYYTWDETYNEMFRKLKCTFPTTVYTPEKLKGIAKNIDEHECRFFATYYFSAESRTSAEKVHAAFLHFKDCGLSCKIRPHPRFSDLKMLHEVFSDFYIEDTKEYSLADSITDSLYTVGLCTTVLSQAYFSGKKVLIDDVSSVQEYEDLKDRGYIMMSRPHELLSEVVKATSAETYDESYLFTKKQEQVL